MLKAPCKDCPDRYLGCHSECQKYIQYNKERKEMQAQKAKNRQLDNDYYTVRRQHRRKDH